MSKSKKNDHVGRRNCSNGFCRLCGEPYPFQLVERATLAHSGAITLREICLILVTSLPFCV